MFSHIGTDRRPSSLWVGGSVWGHGADEGGWKGREVGCWWAGL